MMKKLWMVCIVGCLFFSGCSKEDIVEVNTQNIIQISTEVGSSFQENNFKFIHSKMSKQEKKEVSQKKIKDGWELILKDAGSFEQMDVSGYITEDRNVGYVTYYYENKTIKLMIRFDDKMKIDRININDVRDEIQPKETNDFIETNVKVGYGEMLNGMLTLPKNVGNPPVAILLQGSGASNLNEEAYTYKPFEDIAHGLAELGIASIRYDKRYYAYPEWDSIREVSIAWEYGYDFASVVHQLEDMAVNHNQIYLIGHSQGGMLAPSLTYKHPEIKGFISLAGTPRGLEEVIKDQQINALLNQGFLLEDIQGHVDAIDQNVNKIQSLTEETADNYVIWNLPLSYYFELNQSRAKLFISELKSDMLILQGEEDFQVFYDKDFKEWAKLLENNEYATMRSYPGLSHFFTPSINGTIDDYQTPATFDKTVIEDMASWIKERKLIKRDGE